MVIDEKDKKRYTKFKIEAICLFINFYQSGLVKVSTGALQLEKLSARHALNDSLNINADNKTQLAFAA